MARRLVLVGGGRAHLHVLRELARRPVAGVETVLVAPADHYSAAMIPGYLQGQYEAEDLRIDLDRLAAQAGARIVRAAAERVDVAGGVVVASGERIPFDVCSLDAEGVAGDGTPGVAEHAVAARPAARALELRERVDAMIASAGRPVAVAVVEGDADGLEIALALRERLRASPAGGTVTLVARGTELLGDFEPPLRQLAAEVVRERGVSVVLGGRVTAVSAFGLTLHNGAEMPADLVVWAGRAAAPPIVAASGLARDADGYLLVDRSMRAVDGAPVWGAGDCATIEELAGVSRGGVYAVREAPVLDRSLRAALGRGRAGRYRPQSSYLALLNTGGGWALMRWKGIHRHSRWAWRLKDMIDRRFVRRYRPSDEKSRPAS
jgi:NADH dehydrogenase FAD-containing subunit